MEIMTHNGLFDFEKDFITKDVIHEGLWLHEPKVTVEEYQDYFAKIIVEGEKVGIWFTGLTWPGCGCDVCTKRYAELRANNVREPNPGVWQALLNLTKQGKFRSKTVPCFFGSSETNFGIHTMAHDGKYGVYDLMPNVMDNFGIWENNPDRVNSDYYITQDGESGIIVEHIRKGAPYCIWYAHWQGLNPVNGVGWHRQHRQTREGWRGQPSGHGGVRLGAGHEIAADGTGGFKGHRPGRRGRHHFVRRSRWTYRGGNWSNYRGEPPCCYCCRLWAHGRH
jgi:hypothetical protein